MFRLRGVSFRRCIWTILRVTTQRKGACSRSINVSLLLCFSNGRTVSCRLRVCQTCQHTPLHRFTECKLSPFYCICSNMLPHSDVSCQEALLGHPATSQAKYSSIPKISRSVTLEAVFFESRGIHRYFLHVWVDKCCTRWENNGEIFPKFSVPRKE